MASLNLKKPIITEKSMIDASRGVYTFEVERTATKHALKKEVEEAFNVDVTKVTTTTRKPLARKTGRRFLPSIIPGSKIARLWVKPGQKIELFEVKEK